MKKAFLMLALVGITAAGASAQTQRVNRTNTRTQTTTTTRPTITTVKPVDQTPTSRNADGTLDLSRNPGNGARGVDGTLNTSETSGTNNSGSFIDQRSNNSVEPTTPVTPQGAPITTPVTTSPATTMPATR